MPGIGVLESPQDYEAAIEERDTLIVIHIYSSSDAENEELYAGLDRASNDYANAKFYRLNKDHVQEATEFANYFGTPMLVFFKDGNKIDDVHGRNMDLIRSAIEHHLGSTRW